MYFSGPVKAVILLFESRRIKNTTCLNASWKEITVYSVWNHKHLVWNKKTNGFSLWCFDCLLVPLTAVLTMPHHHSTWAYYMETTAMKNSPIRVVAEEKKRNYFLWVGIFFSFKFCWWSHLFLKRKTWHSCFPPSSYRSTITWHSLYCPVCTTLFFHKV